MARLNRYSLQVFQVKKRWENKKKTISKTNRGKKQKKKKKEGKLNKMCEKPESGKKNILEAKRKVKYKRKSEREGGRESQLLL